MLRFSANVDPVAKNVAKNLNISNSHIRDMVKKWAARYRTFAQKRFVQQSQGGRDWEPLKYRTGLILRDTGMLLGALNPVFVNAPGQFEQILSGADIGIEVGFGASGSYQNGAATKDVATWHQTGAGNLPVRTIIVEPDAKTIQQMEQDAAVAVERIAKEQ